MWHSHLNHDVEIYETKRFIPRWFEFGTTELADLVYLIGKSNLHLPHFEKRRHSHLQVKCRSV